MELKKTELKDNNKHNNDSKNDDNNNENTHINNSIIYKSSIDNGTNSTTSTTHTTTTHNNNNNNNNNNNTNSNSSNSEASYYNEDDEDYDAGCEIIVASSPGDFHVWNMEKGTCTSIFRTMVPPQQSSLAHLSLLSPPAVKEVPDMTPIVGEDNLLDRLERQETLVREDSKIRALYSLPGSNVIFSGGVDNSIRYWDLARPANSCHVPRDEWKRENVFRFKSTVQNNLTIFDEELSTRSLSSSERITPKTNTTALGIPTATHKACITALCCLESPNKLLVSGSRDGVVKVWR